MKPAVVLVDSETGERISGIESVWLVVGKCEGGSGCINFMDTDFRDGCPQGPEMLSALGHLIGHMLYYGVLAGAEREDMDQAWAFLRHIADLKINHVLAGHGDIIVMAKRP